MTRYDLSFSSFVFQSFLLMIMTILMIGFGVKDFKLVMNDTLSLFFVSLFFFLLF